MLGGNCGCFQDVRSALRERAGLALFGARVTVASELLCVDPNMCRNVGIRVHR